MKCYKIWDITDVYYATRKPCWIIAVVANNLKEAKRIGWPEAQLNLEIERYVDMRVRLLRHVDVSHFTKPQVLKNKLGLRLGAYTQATGKCDSCGEHKKLMLTDGKCICDFCATH